MTKRSVSAQRQVELIKQITTKLNRTEFQFISDSELVNKTKILEGEWLSRVDAYINDHESEIGGDEWERKFAIALITKRHNEYLDKKTVKKLTNVLTPPTPKAKSKEDVLKKLRKEFPKASIQMSSLTGEYIVDPPPKKGKK